MLNSSISVWGLGFQRESSLLLNPLKKTKPPQPKTNSVQYLNCFFSHLIYMKGIVVVLYCNCNMFIFLEEAKSLGMEYVSLGDKLVEDGCIHIISLGSKALMIQVWADLNTGAFIFRYGVLVQKQSCGHIGLLPLVAACREYWWRVDN